VDQIVGRLYRNQLGLPDRPAIILTPPEWHEGDTLSSRAWQHSIKNSNS